MWPRPDPRLVAVFALVNGLVLTNAIRHSPFVGYDAADHLIYIETLARGRWPTPDESGQFFAAPRPYVPPALLYAFGTDRWGVVVKAAQLLNVVWSIGLTLALVRLCRAIRPGDRHFALWTLLLLGTLPVYYKTFAFIRGEGLTAFLAVVAVERSLGAFKADGARLRPWLGLGAVLGLLMLSKQWGVFVVAAIVLFAAWCAWIDPVQRSRVVRGVIAGLVVCGAISGWFYLSLHGRFGTVAAFNQVPSPRWSPANRPAEFYTRTGWPAIVSGPVREAFSPGDAGVLWLWPVLYSETWGDYWGYWVVTGRDVETGGWASGEVLAAIDASDPNVTNRATMAPYLGRVNLVATIPSAVAVAGLLLGLARLGRMRTRPPACGGESAALGLAATVVLTGAAGYFVLLVGYPALDVKASYLLHVAPFVAMLGAAALGRADRAWPRASRVLHALLLAGALHNAPVFVTRFTW